MNFLYKLLSASDTYHNSYFELDQKRASKSNFVTNIYVTFIIMKEHWSNLYGKGGLLTTFMFFTESKYMFEIGSHI